MVTDAGFQRPWFIEVRKLGWDYVGRVRGEATYSEEGTHDEKLKALHARAREEASYCGEYYLTKVGRFLTHMYVVKQWQRGRKCKRKDGQVRQDKDSLNYSRSQREPWVLVSSLKEAAKKIVLIYKGRMRIEESFRDMKSGRYGLQLEHSKTHRFSRKRVWLLLCALATLLMWLVGREAERLNYHYQFQANSLRHRRVLSFVYLGCQVLRKRLRIPIDWRKITCLIQA